MSFYIPKEHVHLKPLKSDVHDECDKDILNLYFDNNIFSIMKKFIFFLYPFLFLYANYSDSGPHEVVISGDNFTLSNGQSIEYRLYNPANIDHIHR